MDRPYEMTEMEEGIVKNAIALIDDFGPAGILALERALQKVREYRGTGSLLVAPMPTTGPFIPYRPNRKSG